MNIYEKIKGFVESKARYWYMVAAIFIVLEVMNYSFLNIVVPNWVCGCVSILLILLMTFYVFLLYEYTRNKYQKYMLDRKNELVNKIDLLEENIKEINEKNIELQNVLASQIKSKIEENLENAKSNIIQCIDKDINSIDAHITNFENKLESKVDSNNISICKKVEDLSAAQDKLINIKAESICKIIDSLEKDVNDNINSKTNEAKADIVKQLEENKQATENNVKLNEKLIAISDMNSLALEKELDAILQLDTKLSAFESERKKISESHFENIIDGIASIENKNRENAEIQQKNYEEIHKQLLETAKHIDESTERISIQASDIQNELAKMLIQVLDDMDDNSEKAKRDYDRIFKQMLDFSKVSNLNTNKLEQMLEKQTALIDNNHNLATDSAEYQLSKTDDLKEKIEIYYDIAEKYKNEVFMKIENLRNQIVNLNSFAQVIQNISSIISRGEDEDKKPNRVEKIKDIESNAVVLNHYKENKLVLSEMLLGKKKAYEVEYDKAGKVVRSCNYGSDGEISTKLEFHSNGQVKSRIEKVNIGGKVQMITSKFDEQGNKIK